MDSKKALDKIIRKSRVHLYKPIQIAEILHYYRNGAKINPADLETYRNVSKRWRDEVSKRLIGRVCTSSQKFQDNIFEGNAMPPQLLSELAEYNKKHNGLVENYIYHMLGQRMGMILKAKVWLNDIDTDTFSLPEFLEQFESQPGLRRSIDKAFEICVYALFSTIVRALNVQIEISVKNKDPDILVDFKAFITTIIGIPAGKTSQTLPAKLFRVGVTNAADRGLDIWANFGPAVQVKHVSLSEYLAEDIVDGIQADRIVIVCVDGDAKLIKRVLTQLDFSNRIQGIITVSDLVEWYKISMSKKYQKKLGEQLLADFRREFEQEFPVNTELIPFLKERKYDAKALIKEWTVSED